MDMEVAEIVRDLLRDPAIGVAAQLLRVPRRPDDVEPPELREAQILTEYDADWIERDAAPPTCPVLLVQVDQLPQETPGDWSPATGDAVVAVGCYYVTRRGKAAERRREAAYVRRAIRQALRAAFDPADSQWSPALVSGRTVCRDVQALKLVSVTGVPLAEPIGEATLAGAVLATLHARTLISEG